MPSAELEKSKDIVDRYGYVETNLYRAAWRARSQMKTAAARGRESAARMNAEKLRALMSVIQDSWHVTEYHNWVREVYGEAAYKEIHEGTQRAIEKALRAV